jgi:hypothetical protein
MKKILFVLLFCSLFIRAENNATSINERTVKIVFFDFYDQKVTLKINGHRVLGANLTVQTPSTGLSMIRAYKVKQNNVFELSFGKSVVKKNIHIDSKVKLIYINPKVEPFIVPSDSEIIMLD